MSNESPPQAPPGWYPSADAPGGQRYWDGRVWSDVPAPPTARSDVTAAAPASPDPVLSGRRGSAPVVRPVPAGQRADKLLGTVQWSSAASQWRRWSGKNWVPAMYSHDPAALRRPQSPFDSPPATPDKRARLLHQAVSEEILRGATPVLQDGLTAVLAYKRPVRHVQHACLSILTLGLWTTVWIVMAIARKEDRVRLEVDEWCNVWGSDVPR